MLLLAAAVLFGEEIRGVLGLAGRAGPPSSGVAPAPAATPKDAPGEALREELRTLRAGLRADEDERARRLEEEVKALESALTARLEKADQDRSDAGKAVEALRVELEELRGMIRDGAAKAGPAPGEGGKAGPGPGPAEAPKDLSPEDRLFKDVMEALEKKG